MVIAFIYLKYDKVCFVVGSVSFYSLGGKLFIAHIAYIDSDQKHQQRADHHGKNR